MNHSTCRSCTSTKVITEAAKGITDTEEYKDIKIRITAAKAEMEELKKQASTKVSSLIKEKDKATATIKEFRKKIENILDQMEKDTHQELETEYGRCLEQLEHDIKICSNTINRFDAFTSMLQVNKNDPVEKPSIIFVGIQRAKQTIKFVNEIVQLSKLTETAEYLRFFPEERIVTWLTSLKLLGMFAHQQRPYTQISVETYNVSHMSDKKSCDIYGSCLLDNGDILLTDWDNMKVKRLDEKFNITDTCEVPGNPMGICSINPHEAAVTLTLQQTLQFIKLDKTMTLSRKLVLGESCRGVTCHYGYIYVVCGGFKNENVGTVRIYTIAGSLVKIVETNNSGQRIFSTPITISVSPTGKTYHVTDGQRGVITITQSNDVVSIMSKKEFSWPCGITLDSHDNVLVCCSKSQSILQTFGLFSLDTILTYDDGVRRPSSVCLDKKQLKLIVTSNMSNVVRVFQLKAGPITGVPPQTSPAVDNEQTKKKTTRQSRVKASSVPLKKNSKQTTDTKQVAKSESSSNTGLMDKTNVKPTINTKSKTEINANTESLVPLSQVPKGEGTTQKADVKQEMKTDYKKEPLTSSEKRQSFKNERDSIDEIGKLDEAVSKITNDITKLLTSDNVEKTTADFKSILKKIMDANTEIKKLKTSGT